MRKRAAHSRRLPPPVGPYSQAVIADGLVFCSGMVPLDPATGDLVSGTVEEEVRCVLANLSNLLEDAGSSLDMVLKTTVYLTNLDDFTEMNRVYGEHFRKEPPARTTVQVSRLPLGARLEIEAIALQRR